MEMSLEQAGLSLPFPVLNARSLFLEQPARKPADIKRILESRESEDWVTWNFLTLLTTERPLDWWVTLISAARSANPGIDLEILASDTPRLQFWQRFPSPGSYDAGRRVSMSRSNDERLSKRSADPRPIEGNSEIDVVLTTRRHLIFMESKVGSDISLEATYDVHRNQIVRSVDCLLENSGNREPLFWLLARDTYRFRSYVLLTEAYRNRPSDLARALPHRPADQVEEVARKLALIRWQDLAAHMLCANDADSPDLTAIKRELRYRLSPKP